MKSGAEVIYESMYEVHVSGHACQEELKLIQALTKPKFFIPVHGEYKHLVKHAEIAKSMGMPSDHIIISKIGDVIETDGNSMRIVSQVPAGRVMVDGLGVGDVGSIVLRDRKHLSQDGLIIVVIGIERAANAVVAGPDIISRGFCLCAGVGRTHGRGTQCHDDCAGQLQRTGPQGMGNAENQAA